MGFIFAVMQQSSDAKEWTNHVTVGNRMEAAVEHSELKES